jgi:ABC-type dipeptide/oligopeptide/nickel transport system permease component
VSTASRRANSLSTKRSRATSSSPRLGLHFSLVHTFSFGFSLQARACTFIFRFLHASCWHNFGTAFEQHHTVITWIPRRTLIRLYLMPICILLVLIFSVLYGIWISLYSVLHAPSSIGFYRILRFIPTMFWIVNRVGWEGIVSWVF